MACSELRIQTGMSGRDQISAAARIVLAAMEHTVRIRIRKGVPADLHRPGRSETACSKLRIRTGISGRDQISAAVRIALAAMERTVRIRKGVPAAWIVLGDR